MKLLSLILLSFVLTGCITVPVNREFPKLPASLEKPCDQLEQVPADTSKLSGVLITVTNNYALYHECQAKVDTWLTWYKQQRDIFNSVK